MALLAFASGARNSQSRACQSTATLAGTGRSRPTLPLSLAYVGPAGNRAQDRGAEGSFLYRFWGFSFGARFTPDQKNIFRQCLRFGELGSFVLTLGQGPDEKTGYGYGNADLARPEVQWEALFKLADRLEAKLFNGFNGPRFCKGLAKASGRTVRASFISQLPERVIVDPKTGFTESADVGLVGDWEGFVFDFGPTGLKEVYWNLKRAVAGQASYVAGAIRPIGSMRERRQGAPSAGLA